MLTAQNTAHSVPRIIGRDAGPAARIFRVLAGLTGLIPVVVTMDDVNAALAGIGWLVVVAAIFVGLVALLRPWLDGSRKRRLSPWTGSAILILPFLAYPFGLIPDGPVVGVRLFTDGSVLLAGLIGYGGLEMAAIPALVLRFRPRLYSQYNVVDLVEDAPAEARNRVAAGLAAAVGLIAFAWFWIVPNMVVASGPLAWAKEPTSSLNGAFAVAVIVVAGVLAAVGVTAVGGRAWALTGLLVLFGAGAFVGAMPDALYAAIILTGLGVAVAAALRRGTRSGAGSPSTA